jgi:signal transduction histidine kinase
MLHLVMKSSLSTTLPSTTLNAIIPPLEAVLDLEGAFTICDTDGTVYYGSMKGEHPNAISEAIVTSDEEIGRVVLWARSPDERLSNAVHHLAVTLSYLATETTRRRQLGDEVLHRYDELNLIYGLGMIFSQGMPPDDIMRQVLAQTRQIVRADAGVIYRWDSEKSTIATVDQFGADKGLSQGRVHELALSTLYAYEEAQLFESDRVICAPLRYNDRFLGVLVLLYEPDDKAFTANDIKLLTTLTHNTALFIQAARLFRQLEQRNSELEATNKELQSTRDKLSRAERLSIIGQTVSSLVHDMRNPLNVVMGYAGILQEPDVTLDQRVEYAGQIIQYVRMFSDMAQEILDYTQGDEIIKKIPMAVDAYMDFVGGLLNPPGLARPVKIIINAEAARGYTIDIDSQRFSRIFQNLVNNAIDAIESNGGSQVEILVEPIGKNIRFTVTDDGPGLPPEVLERLFEPFATFGKRHGTGLGLPIVRRMVMIHGGDIAYERAPGGGACFIFTIPQRLQNKNRG